MKKICVVTGTRADYGLLQYLMKLIDNDKTLELQIIATGMHLSSDYGSTYKNIESDGFKINRKIEILSNSDSKTSVSESVGLGVMGFAEAFLELNPNLVLVLGDRFEILSAVVPAMLNGFPIAHLHGGETTEGAYDEAIRHSITKMSHLHFVSNKTYRNRVLQLGENPSNIFISGGLGVDIISNTKFYNKKDLENDLNFEFRKKNLLITFHPETLDKDYGSSQLDQLLLALETLVDTQLLFTMPNADTGTKTIGEKIIGFVQKHPNAIVFTSLGQKRYLSCIKFVDAVVGNSSSGIAESPSFKKGSINIGDRQKGRLKASSVIDCDPDKDSIVKALNFLYSSTFKQRLKTVSNPYGEGGASKFIVDTIKKTDLDEILKKSFNDLPTINL
jgi:GDP/UDP-N,N'-diacetylbacillosamine 2-epimerase (hydrolysing)